MFLEARPRIGLRVRRRQCKTLRLLSSIGDKTILTSARKFTGLLRAKPDPYTGRFRMTCCYCTSCTPWRGSFAQKVPVVQSSLLARGSLSRSLSRSLKGGRWCARPARWTAIISCTTFHLCRGRTAWWLSLERGKRVPCGQSVKVSVAQQQQQQRPPPRRRRSC